MADPWLLLGAVPLIGSWCRFQWLLDDRGPPHPALSVGRIGRRDVVSRPARGGVLQSQKRTLLLLLFVWHVAVSIHGHAGRLWTTLLPVQALVGPREGEVTNPRTPVVISIVLSVHAVSV